MDITTEENISIVIKVCKVGINIRSLLPLLDELQFLQLATLLK